MGLMAVGTAIFAGSTGVPQYFEQKKASRRAERAQKEANETSRASAQVVNARRRRQAIAQARMAQAQNEASMGAQMQGSSTLAGTQAGITSQLGANIGAQNQQIGNQTRMQNLQQRASDAMRTGQERAGMWNVGAQMGSTIMGFAGGAAGGPTSSATNANPWASNTP